MPDVAELERYRTPTVVPARTTVVARALRWVRLDPRPAHRVPGPLALIAATVTALAGSLAADWLIARLAVWLVPSTAGYPHFALGDYATLTVLGVLGACAGWPVVVRLCSAPRWLLARLAVLVTAVLLLPDLAIWLQGQPGKAVAFLVVMHLAIGLITYLALVTIAPPRPGHPTR